MIKNVLQGLEKAKEQNPDKVIFAQTQDTITYQDFVTKAQIIGTFLTKELQTTQCPIAIFLEKSIDCLEAMMGVVYSGNFYTILDIQSPKERIEFILETLQPKTIITNQKNLKKLQQLQLPQKIDCLEQMQVPIEEERLKSIRDNAIDTDPVYILYTSGSTGIPKGTVVCHRSIIDYTTWVKETFQINETTIFGSQTPFYFSMSILDVYTTILAGATLYCIPKMYFSFPVKLLQYLKENHINTIYWVPSALNIVANFKALEEIELPELTKVLFAGEVMPMKPLNYWRKHLPNALYANLYGPTEVTDICTYYIVDREFEDIETLPIGKACDNCNILLIKEDGTQAKQGEEGELCVRGSYLALGYYKNPEKTNATFVQNPLNPYYPEIIYRTGDIVKQNERGEYIYISRKDFQIKHMGYRIELGEIETRIQAIEGIIACCALYEEQQNKIVLYYQSNCLTQEEVLQKAKEKLVSYMLPNQVIRLEKMPYNANGKINRTELKRRIRGE